PGAAAPRSRPLATSPGHRVARGPDGAGAPQSPAGRARRRAGRVLAAVRRGAAGQGRAAPGCRSHGLQRRQGSGSARRRGPRARNRREAAGPNTDADAAQERLAAPCSRHVLRPSCSRPGRWSGRDRLGAFRARAAGARRRHVLGHHLAVRVGPFAAGRGGGAGGGGAPGRHDGPARRACPRLAPGGRASPTGQQGLRGGAPQGELAGPRARAPGRGHAAGRARSASRPGRARRGAGRSVERRGARAHPACPLYPAGDAGAVESTCAMGYWRQAMSLFHQLWTPPVGAELAAGLAASERGLALTRTPRERDYLAAIRTYYADYGGTDHKTRLVAYAHAMEGMRRRYPRDREASTFYALSLIALAQATATDTTFGYQKRADAILEPLFKVEPRHPGLAHYLIHTNDVPQLARLGLYAARRYAEIAPDVPHAQHLPARYALERGRWRDATALAVRPAPEWRAAEAITHFARALGAARSGDTASARSAVSALDEIERAEVRRGARMFTGRGRSGSSASPRRRGSPAGPATRQRRCAWPRPPRTWRTSRRSTP